MESQCCKRSGVARNPQALCSGGGPEADRDIQHRGGK
ncbi:hypothetical protein AK812_SmicGene48895, partial [Symbiodinium microadriaticum]